MLAICAMTFEALPSHFESHMPVDDTEDRISRLVQGSVSLLSLERLHVHHVMLTILPCAFM